jgi:hypothetical protein
MTAEKLGKAVLLRTGADPDDVKTTHKAFVRFLRRAARNSNLQGALQLNSLQMRNYVEGLLPIAEQIERLVPALAQDGPNVEYPWETPSGQVVSPASYGFPVVRELSGPNGHKLLRLLQVVMGRFDAIFR